MPRNPDPQLARQWRSRLARFRKSGDTVAQFCRAEGVSAAAFYQWKRKLDDRSSPEREQTAPQFVPVQLVDDDLKGDNHVVQIQLPNGAMVRVPASLESGKLCQLIRHVVDAAPRECQSC